MQQAQVRQARQSAQVSLGSGSVRYSTELPGSTLKEQGIDYVTPDTGWTCWRQLNMCSKDKFYVKGRMMTVSLGRTNTQQEQVQDGGTDNLMAKMLAVGSRHGRCESRRDVRKGCRLAYLLLSEPPKASWPPQAECAGSQALSASRLCTGQHFVPQRRTPQPCLGLAAFVVMMRVL